MDVKDNRLVGDQLPVEAELKESIINKLNDLEIPGLVQLDIKLEMNSDYSTLSGIRTLSFIISALGHSDIFKVCVDSTYKIKTEKFYGEVQDFNNGKVVMYYPTRNLSRTLWNGGELTINLPKKSEVKSIRDVINDLEVTIYKSAIEWS